MINLTGNKYKTVWNDGYIAILINDNGNWKLEGNKRLFKAIHELEAYYKGIIKTFERV